MYGHGAPPPARSAATVISLRVLVAAVGVLTCGVFACVPLFRVALLRGRAYQWILAWLSLPVCVVCFMVIGVLPEADPRTDVALGLVLLIGAAGSAWFVTVDIRFHHEQRRAAGYGGVPLPQGLTAHPGHSTYGYPQPVSPYAQTHVPHTPAGPAPTPMPLTPPPTRPPGTVPPTSGPPPGPARIDQVRAELDELSDYLRRQNGGQQDGTQRDGT